MSILERNFEPWTQLRRSMWLGKGGLVPNGGIVDWSIVNAESEAAVLFFGEEYHRAVGAGGWPDETLLTEVP
jgi:hypothetical protein